MSHTILIVDDEPGNIDVLKGVLPEGLKVKAAISPLVALKIATKQMPDLIFLDVMMPQMSGYEAFAEFKKLPGGDNVKIVFVSGNDTRKEPQAAGADGHVMKPISPKVIEEIIHKLLG